MTPTSALALAVVLTLPQSQELEHRGYDPNAERLSADAYQGELGAVLREIEGELRCSCGCGLDLHSCQFAMQCSVSPGWSARIMAALERGESREAIRAGFVADFGQTVLMAPPAQGFNLLAYLLPGLAILTAGALLVRTLRTPSPTLGPSGEAALGRAPLRLSQSEEDRLAEELRKVEELERPDW